MLEGVAADDFVTDVDTAARNLTDLIDEVRCGSVVDGEVGAHVLADLEFLGTASDGDHGCAAGLGQVDCSGTHTTSSGRDQDGLAFFELGPFVETEQGCWVVDQKCG